MELGRISACISLNDSVVTQTEAVSNNKVNFLLPRESKKNVPGGGESLKEALPPVAPGPRAHRPPPARAQSASQVQPTVS